MIESLVNAWKLPDVRRKLLFTLAMLIIFRMIAHIPVPGVDPTKLGQLFQTNQLMGMLDLFSGGTLTTFSIAALGVYPYITATIIMQLLVPIIPSLEELSKEGGAGHQLVNQYTHWLTVPLALLQGYGTGILLQNQGILTNFGFGSGSLVSTLAIVVSMAAGTVLLTWIGELITENGIGNGVSVIIFAGIVSRLPTVAGQAMAGGNLLVAAFFGAIGILMVASIVVIQEGQRRIPVQYAKRMRGNRIYGGQSTHIPLRVNSAGMIPLIFAMSIMLLPGTAASYLAAAPGAIGDAAAFIRDLFSTTGFIYWFAFFVLVVAFTFFYTWVVFQQQRLSENLQKYGGFIPGIRPGRPTEEYLNRVLFRITIIGAVFLGVVAIVPGLTQTAGSTSLVISSTGLLIVVGVVLDTMKQLEAQLMMRNYEGFIK